MKPTTANKVYLFTILAMCVYIFYLQACGGRSHGIHAEYENEVIMVKMEKPKYFEKRIPVPVEVRVPADTVYIASVVDSGRIDSAACVELARDHYTEYEYMDTVQDDTVAIYTHATVKENKIQYMETGYQVKVPFITNNYYTKPRVKVFVHGQAGLGLTFAGAPGQFFAGAGATIIDKKEFMYTAGVDFSTSGQVTPRFGFGVKLSFRRK